MSRLPLMTALRIAPIELRTRATARILMARRRDPFTFEDASYSYLLHHYNTTWRNERTVEVPLAARLLANRTGARMLEIGNVLQNYLSSEELPADREIVDKYEVAPGVRNVDIVDHRPERPYDLIVSISTLEHVGWDEEPQDPTKAARAIEMAHRWLGREGELLVTLPLGHHPELDGRLLSGPPLFERLHFMRRVNANNLWAQATADEVRGASYGSPFPFANAIAVGRSRGSG